MNTCQTCRWHKRAFYSYIDYCHHELAIKQAKPDPVNGKIDKSGYWTCGAMRLHSGVCGYEGRLWEPKVMSKWRFKNV